jgi:hypothetical protein
MVVLWGHLVAFINVNSPIYDESVVAINSDNAQLNAIIPSPHAFCRNVVGGVLSWHIVVR